MDPFEIKTKDGESMTVRLALESEAGEIRRLCNLAYKELADLGLNYTATYQDEKITLERMRKGRTFVLTKSTEIIATISVRDENWISQRKCAYVGQFGVTPALKRRGLGTLLMDFVEDLALREGYECVQLDTAKPALHLVDFYVRRGYRIVSETRFEGKTYESWVFEKDLD